jgi:hypothetical protein
MRQTLLTFALFCCASPAWAQLTLGTTPPPVTLSGEDGARVDGKPWSSDMIRGKVFVLFYVDPDNKGLNEELKASLKKEDFDKTKYGSIAIINMDATWLPNAIIASSLESNQEEFPDVTYVKDLNKVMVKKWGLKDDAFDVAVFGKKGELLMHRDGDFSKEQIAELIALIKSNL